MVWLSSGEWWLVVAYTTCQGDSEGFSCGVRLERIKNNEKLYLRNFKNKFKSCLQLDTSDS